MKPIYLLACLMAMTAYANQNEVPQLPIKVATPALPDEPVANISTPILGTPTTLSDIIQLATLNKDYETLATHLPEYEKNNTADPLALAYAKAVLLIGQGKRKSAIAIYRQMLAQRPDLSPIRFELAQVLYDDKQMAASKDQFTKLLSDDPPPMVQKVSMAYLNAITKKSRPQIDFSLNYLREDNINNANHSPNIADSPFTKSKEMYPKSATGLSYGLSVSHDHNIVNNHYLAMGADLHGKYYHHEKDYNDTLIRTTLGHVYQDEKQRLAMLPFYEKRWYGGDEYQQNVGARGEYSYWLNPRWQINTAMEYANQRYTNNKELNGHTSLVSATVLHLHSPKRYVYAGLDVSDDNTAEKNYASKTHRVRLGLGQEWGWGLSGRFGISVAKRKFDDFAIIGGIIPLDVIRDDTEYGITATLWKRDWHWLGITPKLTHSYKKVDSNIPSVYSYDRHQTYVVFEKTF